MQNSDPAFSFPLTKETKINMQKQRAMIKVIVKLKSGNFAVGSYGAVISIWNPDKKILIQAWRAKGMVSDLIEIDNKDLIAGAQGNVNCISIYKYNDDEDRYKSFDFIDSKDAMISSLVKLDNNNFIYGTMDNTLVFYNSESNGSYIKEKEVELEQKEKYDCIYSLIKLSNGNYASTGLTIIKLINSSLLKFKKCSIFLNLVAYMKILKSIYG